MRGMISDSSELKPTTLWRETTWSQTREEKLVDCTSDPRLCVAALLPFLNGQLVVFVIS